MGGLFSSPKAPPPPPDTSEEDARRAAALEAEERRERKGISSRKKAKGCVCSFAYDASKTSTWSWQQQPVCSNATLGGNDGGVRNPRQTG